MTKPTERPAKSAGPWAALHKVLQSLQGRAAKLEASAPKVGDLMTVALTAEDLGRIKARRLTLEGKQITILVLET